MKTFNQFITEANYGHQGHQALDDYKMSKRSDTPLKVGRLGKKRKKSDAEKKRVKAVGGGKTAPAKTYKDRKDIGTNKPRSKVEQQPQKERGAAALSAKDPQKKAYLERKRREKGEKTPTRTQLLTKKTKTVDPKYKSQKASGYTTGERQKITRSGERLLKDIKKKKEKPASHYDPGVRKN